MSIPKNSFHDSIFQVLHHYRESKQKMGETPEFCLTMNHKFRLAVNEFIQNNTVQDDNFNLQVTIIRSLCDPKLMRPLDLSSEITRLFLLFFKINVPAHEYESVLLNLQKMMHVQGAMHTFS